ncbi:hypothetical protein ACFVRD_49010 [Streptomyces sp. NPDC057908]|uniref:hypothetical protein n=1 Tax=Streptomyces sp. NPDC057908 TaxID=3346276 RepID=UPI0036E525C1
MTTPRRTARRPLAPRVAAPREPVDPARIGRRVVPRRAKGMDAGAVAAALEEALFDARQASRHEDLANDDRGRAELAEWERPDQLLAAAAPGAVYDPETEDFVRAELAAEAAAAKAREAALREAARIAARADELQALRELGTLEQTEPRRDELTRRAGAYIQGDVDAWFAYALAAYLGHRPRDCGRPSATAGPRPRRTARRTRPPGPRSRRRPAGVRGPARHHRTRSHRGPRRVPRPHPPRRGSSVML